MVSRRTFLSLVAGSMAVPQWSVAQPASQQVALYANVGADLTHYDVDVDGATLIKQATVTLPAVGGKKVFKGGENGIVVYSINQSSGEPTLIQNIETRAIHPRTFHIDPSGRLLVAQHNLPVNVRDGDAIRMLPAGLSVLRIGDDGKLTFVRKYDIDVGDRLMFWMGMVPL